MLPFEPLESGTIIERYSILKLIKAGGQAHVYQAEDKQIGQQVAIKVIALDLHSDDAEETQRLFHREMEAPVRLDGYLHILPLLSYGSYSHKGRMLLYLVMPFCKGGG